MSYVKQSRKLSTAQEGQNAVPEQAADYRSGAISEAAPIDGSLSGWPIPIDFVLDRAIGRDMRSRAGAGCRITPRRLLAEARVELASSLTGGCAA